MSALDELDSETAAVVTDVVRRRAPELLVRLTTSKDLSGADRARVERCLADEFASRPLGPDYEPGEEAKKVDDAIGKFLLRFPFQRTR